MPPWLRAFPGLAENIRFGSQHPYSVVNDHLKFQFQGIGCPLLASFGSCRHTVHINEDKHICLNEINVEHQK